MSISKFFRKSTVCFSIGVFMWLIACTPLLVVTQPPSISLKTTAAPFAQLVIVAPSLVLTETPALTSTPDIWEIHPCYKTNSVFGNENTLIWRYTGNIEGHGRVDMILNVAEDNEIRGFLFDFEGVREYRINGCVTDNAFTMWLQQGDVVNAVINGEFPETDPRGYFPSDKRIAPYIITGLIMAKDNSVNSAIYLRFERGSGGTMEHRFRLDGVKDDIVILNASQQFLTAIANDDRILVVDLVHFPVQVFLDGERKIIQTPETFLAYYNAIFGDGFKERLALTFPNYIISETGNFGGTYLYVYGGGRIQIDMQGKIVKIDNWTDPLPTPIATVIGTP